MKTTPVAPDLAQNRLVNNQTEAHPFCFVCSGSNPMGLALRYEPEPDGSVSAKFLGHSALEGYSGLLHGGVIAAMLDGAMTNCLFARGIRGLTAELKVRYHESVTASEEVFLQA
jgi:acyl-coenzyme A thioesterase PaaI-like protein